ncbi:MAG: site-2 protease family protein [Methanomicrobiales archaeon]|nr:site-2 protease family protein [Methanomicrobiales archaeon]
MNWLLIVLLLIGAYALVAYTIKKRGLWQDRITFYGPVMAVKTRKVAFFDRFIPYSTLMKVYGTAGVAVVVLVATLGTVMLFFALQFTFLTRPEPTGIYAPQNILLLPGVNEFVPSTFAVWFAFVLTIAVHEFGHGILCRVEQIRVRAMGVLLAVIPIGFFVEPDEEELEKAPAGPKCRIFGAGITNNLLVGCLCGGLLLFVMAQAVPVTDPVIHGVYQGFPADDAGVPQNSFVRTVNGQEVHSVGEVATILNGTRPGDHLVLEVEKDSVLASYELTLSAWPRNVSSSPSGFMGVSYYPGTEVLRTVRQLAQPIGFLYLVTIPFESGYQVHELRGDAPGGTAAPPAPLYVGGYLRLLAFESPEQTFYQVPFAGFWELVHLLFWCAWINVNVGIFNALPMVPLDGGYILKEGVQAVLRRKGLGEHAERVVVLFSAVILTVMVMLISLPYLFHLI